MDQESIVSDNCFCIVAGVSIGNTVKNWQVEVDRILKKIQVMTNKIVRTKGLTTNLLFLIITFP